jgi:hypothetical protein
MIVLIVAANRAASGSTVTVNFKGTGSGSYNGTPFVGAFDYDPSLTSTNGQFQFQGSGLNHGVVYKIAAGQTFSAQNSLCDPFTITTTGGNFTILAVDPKTPTLTNVTIVVPSSGLSQTNLPGCSIFPATAPTGSTFTLTVNGATTFSGTISTITSCTGPAVPFPIATCPPPYDTYTSAYTAPCPQYACPPRQSCFLTRLFARRSCRSVCW